MPAGATSVAMFVLPIEQFQRRLHRVWERVTVAQLSSKNDYCERVDRLILFDVMMMHIYCV
jgi:hypothetical protein